MQPSKTKKLADAFGVLGYLSTVLVWLWTGILILPGLLKIDAIKTLVTPEQTNHPIEPLHISYQNPPQWVVFLLVALAFFVVIVGVWAAIKAPKRFVESTSKATHTAASRLALEVTHRKPVPQKRLSFLTEQLVFIIKFSIVLIGLIMIFIAALWAPSDLPAGVTLIVGAYLGIWPLLWFGLQFILARSMKKQSFQATL